MEARRLYAREVAPLDHDEFVRWRQQADAAAETAQLARAGGRHEWACFLSEQAAQLGVKGLLHGVGADAWGHDLVVLCATARAQFGEGFDVEEPAARLARHYIPTRYPDAHPSGAPSSHYTAADATQALDDATTVLDALDATWRALGGSR